MAKLCKHCNKNPVFGGGFCKYHQYMREKKPKPVKSDDTFPDSEMDVFLTIWAERPHVSELSGERLPYSPSNKKFWVCQFLHVLNKGRFPSLRTDKRNILLGTPQEHDHQDRYEAFTKRKEELLSEVYG
jgi:hypothetical protein